MIGKYSVALGEYRSGASSLYGLGGVYISALRYAIVMVRVRVEVRGR